MKNSRLIAAFLAATFMISCAPVQAQEPVKRVGVVKKQFNESLTRFKRCLRGKCDRWEALKVARDLGIAAVAAAAVVGVGALAGREIQRRWPKRTAVEPASGAEPSRAGPPRFLPQRLIEEFKYKVGDELMFTPEMGEARKVRVKRLERRLGLGIPGVAETEPYYYIKYLDVLGTEEPGKGRMALQGRLTPVATP